MSVTLMRETGLCVLRAHLLIKSKQNLTIAQKDWLDILGKSLEDLQD